MYACIDLGSNSFHLLIAKWHGGKHDIVERFSEKVQLGEGVSDTQMISPAAFQRGIRCLTTFAHALARYPVSHCWVVGTNALRVARNADQFLDAARKLNIEIDVISGLEEAALVYAGVTSGVADPDQRHLVIDIGGGSTELVVGEGARMLQCHSMPVGCVTWRDRWFPTVMLEKAGTSSCLDRAVNAAQSLFATVSETLHKTPWDHVYASSGTAKMLAAVCAYRAGTQPGYVDIDTLQALRSDVEAVLADPGHVLPGLKSGRRDLIAPGWSVLLGFMRACDVSRIAFSASALREGMLIYMVRAATSGVSPLHVLRDCSVDDSECRLS